MTKTIVMLDSFKPEYIEHTIYLKEVIILMLVFY